MSVTMTKRLEFDAAHRLVNHESKCSHLHGHRYVVEVTLELDDNGALDKAGRIVDFGDVKRMLGGWIDDNLDHACIVNEADMPLRAYLEEQRARHLVFKGEPSAENLATYILSVARDMLDVDGQRSVTSVVLFETPTSRAEAR